MISCQSPRIRFRFPIRGPFCDETKTETETESRVNSVSVSVAIRSGLIYSFIPNSLGSTAIFIGISFIDDVYGNAL